MLRPKTLMTAPDKVDLGLRELKDPLDNWQKTQYISHNNAYSVKKIFCAAVDEFPCRLKAVINSKGNHFE